jgi:hypothetical protein
MSAPRRYGLLAEFATADALLDAVHRVHEAGYRQVEAFSPFPVEGLADAIGFHSHRVPLLTFLGGVVGGLGGYLMQWYAAAVDYPINVGGRPLHSWPSFIPITFELAVLGAALFAAFGMLALNGLPRLSHPLFTVPEFELASRNRFFLCLRADEPGFDDEQARQLLNELEPLKISEVAA